MKILLELTPAELNILQLLLNESNQNEELIEETIQDAEEEGEVLNFHSEDWDSIREKVNELYEAQDVEDLRDICKSTMEKLHQMPVEEADFVVENFMDMLPRNKVNMDDIATVDYAGRYFFKNRHNYRSK